MKGECGTKARCAVDARVVRCDALCREHVLIEARVPRFPASDPGQFVQLLCRQAATAIGDPSDWPKDGFPSVADADFRGRQAYLRRPFSIADQWTAAGGAAHVCVISRTIGPGTCWLEHLHPGDVINVTGPLGRGFRVPPKSTPVVLVGGGVGIPPLLYFARCLHERSHRDIRAIFGATTRELLPLRLTAEPAHDATPRPCVELPANAAYPVVVTSDDGSVGMRGVVTDALRAWCEQRTPGRAPVVFACGPEGMLRAVAWLTRALGWECQLCIERNMGCGTGTCLSCIVRVRDPARREGWRWALACQDGPVFDRDELLDCQGDAGT